MKIFQQKICGEKENVEGLQGVKRQVYADFSNNIQYMIRKIKEEGATQDEILHIAEWCARFSFELGVRWGWADERVRNAKYVREKGVKQA
jgi:hypothetical protein